MNAPNPLAQQRAHRAAAWLAEPFPLQLQAGALETLKWLALASMVVDHANACLFGSRFHAAQAFGRLAFPLFAFVLAYNLARHTPPKLHAVARRMALAGIAAQLPFWLMVHSIWRFNIFATFLVSLAIIKLSLNPPSRKRDFMIAVCFFIGGIFVDFLWYGIAVVLCAYYWCKVQTRGALLALLAAIAALTLLIALPIGWPALASLVPIPIVWYAQKINPPIPRYSRLFYIFYPAHLTILVLLAIFVAPKV